MTLAAGSRGDPAGLEAAFGAGLRWSTAAESDAPHIPVEVVLAGGDELVWSAAGGSTRFELHAAGALESGAVRRAHVPVGQTVGAVHVAAGKELGALFESYQTTAGGGLRSVHVSRMDPLASALQPPGAFLPSWTHTVGPASIGAHYLHGDDDSVVLAVQRPSDGVVQVDWLDASSGAWIVRAELPGAALRGMTASQAGTRVALAVDNAVHVLERSGVQVTVMHSANLAAPAHALALSADGQHLAFGDGNALVVLSSAGAGFGGPQTLEGEPSELPLAVALTAAGDAGIVGWWDAASARSARAELFDLDPVSGFTMGVGHAQSNPAGGPQEYLADVALSADGRRGAAAFWGGGGGAAEVVLLDRALGTLMAVDLPGSAFGVDLDERGTRVAVAAKATHANTLSALGAVHLIDTGERDLQVVGSPDLGGTLELALQRPGLDTVLFLLGPPAPGSVLPGLAGTLALDPAARWIVELGSSSATDPALGPDLGSAQLSVPALAGLAGLDLACQAVSSAAGGPVAFSAIAVRPALF